MPIAKKSSRTPSKVKSADTHFDRLPEKTASQYMTIDRIRLPVKQPRQYFNSEKQAQLVASIKEYGILEPLLVRPLSNGEFELVAGERRLRAAKAAKLTEVPVVIRELDDKQALQVALTENLQREDLNPVEETEAVLTLLAIELGITTDQVVSLLNHVHNAKKRGQELTHNVMGQLDKIDWVLTTVGRFTADSFRANRLPLLSLPADVLEMLRQDKLKYTKAKLIAQIKEDETRQFLLKEAIEHNLSLSEIRARVKRLNEALNSHDSIHLLGQSFSERTSEILKRLKHPEVWKNNQKRKKAEKLLAELEKLVES